MENVAVAVIVTGNGGVEMVLEENYREPDLWKQRRATGDETSLLKECCVTVNRTKPFVLVEKRRF